MFDPFESRLCRDVRNKAGDRFIRAVKRLEPGSLHETAHKLKTEPLPEHITAYLDQRNQKLAVVLNDIDKYKDQVHLSLFDLSAVVMWNRSLFFEVHEWLEHKWINSDDDHKKGLQAVIMTAVVYEQLTYHRRKPAASLAQKALSGIRSFPAGIPAGFDKKILITHLSNLDLGPPVFPVV